MASPRFAVRSIAVIGAGPSGLAAAKYLKAQGAFDRIVVYEQRPEVGGVWNYSDKPTPDEHIPQTSAFLPTDPPIRDDAGKSAPIFPSPMYELLHVNIPHTLMAYSDLPFPAPADGSQQLIFPKRQVVLDYLVRYSQDIRNLLRLSTSVDDVRLVPKESGADSWEVHTTQTTDGAKKTETFDAVVVAWGHYDTTFTPDIAGLAAFAKAHPGVVTHAKRYRRPEDYKDKKVIVVGNAASGVDIALQISAHARKPLLLSVRSPTPADSLDRIQGGEEVPEIREFLAAERGVRFADGRVERDVDAVVFCTGYLFSLPFLERSQTEPGADKTRLHPLLSTGQRIYGLFLDMIHIEHPTLAFVGVPVKTVPFPIAESQSAVLARAWANQLALPPPAAMHEWERETEKGREAAFHVWPPGGDGAYINATYDRIMGGDGSERPGKVPPRWNPEALWVRSIAAAARGRFEDTGRKATSLAELGYVFDGNTGQV